MKDKTFSLKWYVIGLIIVCTVFGYAVANSTAGGDMDYDLSDIELLGKYVFFDKISSPKRMACVTCHDPATGGTGSVSGVNLHQVAITGANPHTVGSLKPPTNAYASLIPPLFINCPNGIPGICGGNFWNGRALGDDNPNEFPGATKHIGNEVFYTTIGDPVDPVGEGVWEYAVYFGPTADQALNPMPNKVEQNIDRLAVCRHVASAKYAELYERVWGVPIDCSDDSVAVSAPDVDDPPEKAFDISFKRLMLAVCAWQASTDLNSFTSKRDMALRRELEGIDVDDTPGEFPLVGLTDEENLGHDLFYGKAGCAACHSDNPGIDTGAEPFQLYSDQGYHNIGTPRNPEIPETFNEDGSVVDPDFGLAGLTDVKDDEDDICIGFSRNCDHRGFVKTPTIRNVDKRKGKGFIKAYTHNGWFKSLKSIVHFYNTALIGGATAELYGVTRCPPGIETEKDARANNCWPAPAYDTRQVGSPAIGALLGDLDLTEAEEDAIVAYMKTLTDEHTPKRPKPYKPAK